MNRPGPPLRTRNNGQRSSHSILPVIRRLMLTCDMFYACYVLSYINNMQPMLSSTDAKIAKRIDPNIALIDSQPINDDSYRLNPKYLIHLKSLQTLPNQNQVFFPDKQYHEPRYPSGHALHPAFDPGSHDTQSDWTVTVYDDADVDKLIRPAAKQGLITQEECDILVGTGETPPAHIVERSDLCRFLLLYLEGRFCVDTDRIVSLPMS